MEGERERTEERSEARLACEGYATVAACPDDCSSSGLIFGSSNLPPRLAALDGINGRASRARVVWLAPTALDAAQRPQERNNRVGGRANESEGLAFWASVLFLSLSLSFSLCGVELFSQRWGAAAVAERA